MAQCKIHLENYTGTYYPGAEIRGRVECYLDTQIILQSIKVALTCKEHNQWTETSERFDSESNARKSEPVSFTGEHQIFNLEHKLFGPERGGTVVLSRGRHAYPFYFLLPQDIPSSFSGPHGSVLFKLRAVVDRPSSFALEDEFMVMVSSPMDFNRMPRKLQNPVSHSEEKTVGCCCCRGGEVSMDVELPKSAFIVGEIFPVKVHVSNMSTSKVKNVTVKLTKTVTYKVTSPRHQTKKDNEEILSHKDHGVGAHGEHVFNMLLHIPEHIMVPNFSKCDLFKVEYVLKVSCEMAGCTMNLDVNVKDVVVGHADGRGREMRPPPYPMDNIGFGIGAPVIPGGYPNYPR